MQEIRDSIIKPDMAIYKCLDCGNVSYYYEPGQVKCECGHIYMEWLNYEDFESARDNNEATRNT